MKQNKISYDVVDEHGRSSFQNMDQLKRYLGKILEKGLAITPIRRIVRVTREDIELLDFVDIYNKCCKRN